MNYPKAVIQTVWRRIRKPAPGFISENAIRKAGKQEKEGSWGGEGSLVPDSKSFQSANPRSAPRITCRGDHKSTQALVAIIRSAELGIAQLPPSLLNMAREALRR